jgi:hypothetical protein
MKVTKATLRELIKEELEAMQDEAPLDEEETLSEEEEIDEVTIGGAQAAKIKKLAYQLYNATMNLPTSSAQQRYYRDSWKNRD